VREDGDLSFIQRALNPGKGICLQIVVFDSIFHYDLDVEVEGVEHPKVP
jgi:hypothetical protein